MRGIEISIKAKKLILKKELCKEDCYREVNKENYYSLSIFKKPTTVTGISSRCADGLHVLFLDYDSVCKWIVEQDIMNMINARNLSSFFLFKTQERTVAGQKVGNYHAVCLEKFYPANITELLRESHCDRAYVTMPLREDYRSWVLRTSGKGKRGPAKYIKTVHSLTLHPPISTAHKELLLKLYPKIDMPKYGSEDGLTKLYKATYQTTSRT